MNIGQIYFKKYRILDLIGMGGTSSVYLAENIKLGNKWAIKVASKNNNQINLLAEPHILKNLNHYAIPTIIDVEEDEDNIYIIEEYIEGLNLQQFKTKERFISSEQVIDFAFQMCDILQYLHTREPNPIIYRDIKPENIIYTKEGLLKLIDFGISREYKEESLSDTSQIGTRGYAAPEQYGIAQSDERTDIFSLGVTLYYLLTGENLSNPPYKIQSISEFNSQVPKQLEEIVLKCCEPLPNKRFQNVGELKSELLKLKVNEHVIVDNPPTYKKLNISMPNFIKQQPKTEENSISKTISIGIIGVVNGVGVTHFAIMLANYLAKKNKVAIIELNGSKHFEQIGLSTNGEKALESDSFNYRKVDYYYHIPYNQFIFNHRDDYDCIILDCGSYECNCDLDEFVRSDKRLVMGHGIDWKINEIVKFSEKTKDYDPNEKWRYVIPFLKKTHLKEIKKHVKNKMYTVSFNSNPFMPSNDVIKEIKGIIS
jgi:serine/threonine-protein kinase